MIRFVLSLILALFVAAPAAHALTVDEIEAAWANVGQVTGTFQERYEDGSTSSGTFTVYGPTLIVMKYENNTVFAVNGGTSKKVGAVHATGRKVTIIDGWNGEAQQYDLGPFRQLLSETPELEQVLAGTGESATELTLRLRDPRAPKRGHIDITWSSQTGKMLRWHTVIDGSDVTTTFRY
jgi:outer membrane lipoprotein-sorting protein